MNRISNKQWNVDICGILCPDSKIQSKRKTFTSAYFLCFSLLLLIANGFAEPMEPARSTLFILLNGMSPNTEGLIGEDADPCKSYETSSIWGKTGFAKYLQNDITNSKAMIYSRAFRRPADSPNENYTDFANPVVADSLVTCKTTKQTVPYYDKNSQQLSYTNTGSSIKINSILHEALDQWFNKQLVESEIQGNESPFLRSTLQKQRNAWNEANPKASFPAIASNMDTRLKTWINSWKVQHGVVPTLANLQADRPDLVPSRYVVIANGIGGLVAREYIQSFAYNGEIDKVVFVNTPHEGTGFADQLLFSQNYGYDISFDVALAIPFAILASLSPIGDAADNEINTFFSSVVQSQALKIASGTVIGGINQARSSYSVYDPALWYLSQDADRRDMKYRNLIALWNLDENNVQVNKHIGALQYLNSTGMGTAYRDPRYRMIYSYGLPSMGNSRRLSLDYFVQKKSHITQENFNNALSKMIVNKINDEYSKMVQHYFDTSGTAALTEDVINNLIYNLRLHGFAQSAIDLDVPGDTWLHNRLDNILQKSLDSLKADDLVNKGAEKALGAAVNQGIIFCVQKIVDNANINIEELDPILVDFIAAAEYLIPTQYSSQIMSSVLPSLSPKPKGMKLSDGNAAQGQEFMAGVMANAPLHFFDQGTFDVPAHSAYGGNVSVFSGSNADVKRSGYALNELDLSEHGNLNAYTNTLKAIGANKATQDIVNKGLLYGCSVQPIKWQKDLCKTVKLVLHYAYLVNESVSAGVAATSMLGALDDTRELAFNAVVTKNNALIFKSVASNSTKSISYKDLDALLFESPHINLQSVQGNVKGSHKSIPLLLFTVSGDSVSVPEVSSVADLKTVYLTQDEDSLLKKVVPLAVDLTSLQDVDYSSSNWYRSLTIKNIINDLSTGNRRVKRSLTPAFTASDYIREFRFQVDDLRPDQLWQIKLDFNALTQIALERDSLYNWKGFIRINGGSWSDLGSLPRPPVDENGLFVFRPEEFLQRTGKDGIPLAVISQLEQDGPNVISVMLVNRVGLQSNQQFSYYFTATAPLIREGWPNALQYVSSLNQVHVSMSNLGNPYDADSAKVRLIRVGEDATAEVLAFVPATIAEVPSDSTAWGATWSVQCNLGNVIDSLKLANGEYILQWRIATASRTESRQISWYTMNTTIFIDTQAPELALHLPKKSLTGSESDGTWANLENPVTSSDKVLREVRTFLSYAKNGSTDTVPLYRHPNLGASSMGITWLDSVAGLPEGLVTLHAQAIDYAEPNETMANAMDSIRSKDSSVSRSSWNTLLNSQGKFKPGVNGVAIKSSFWIDKTAPTFDPSSVEILAVADSSAPVLLSPVWNGANSPEKITLNARQLLRLGIQIQEPLLQRSTDSVSIQIIFLDSVQSVTHTYVRMIDVADSSHFVFTEPSAQKLADGIYRISLTMIDEAGNASESMRLSATLVVDRRAPVILDVLAGEPVYASRSDVDSAHAYLSQSADYAPNRSVLQCYQRLIVPGSTGTWVALNTLDTLSKSGVNQVLYGYSMSDLIGSHPNGRWSTQFGCFDAVGNFGSGSDVFGVGNRYPQITYPTSATVLLFNTDKIQIQGVAPNPVVPNGNEQTSEFKLEWRREGDANWTADGIAQTSSGVSTLNRSLAIWDRTPLAAGEYELRLSVRGCTDATNAGCDWVFDIQSVTLDDIDAAVIAAKPTIVITTPTHQVPGDSAQAVSARLMGLADGSKWSMDMKIMVSDPWDTAQKVTALTARFDSMAMSPFFGIPAGAVPDGFSLWQAADGEWTLKWKGRADSKNAGTAPVVRLGYTQGSVNFSAPAPVYVSDDTSIAMPGVSFGTIRTVSYDRIRTWALESSSAQEFSLQFRTDKPFMVDLSTIDGAEQTQHWGASRLNYASSGMGGMAIPYVYVDPENYATHLFWNGLTRTGLYPGAPKAKVLLTATENRNGGQVVTAEAEWGLALGAVRIVSDDIGPGQFIVAKALTAAGSDTLNRLGNIGYQFGVVGQAAKVTAVVRDSAGNLVKTLMNAEPVLAGSQHNSQMVQWDGVSENGFAITHPGNYEIVVTAQDFSGNTDTRSYPFAMKFAGGLLPAPAEEPGGIGTLAALSMDEAFVDSMGNLRFVGMPDYLLKANISAQTLPEDQRVFAYHWDLAGTQQPAFYRANRFSLGVRRTRNSFPVTVVILMATQGRNFDWKCDPLDLKVGYKMIVEKVYFNKGNDGGLYWDSDLWLDAGLEIVAYDSYKSGTRYPIKVAVQVLPEFAYEDIMNKSAIFHGEVEIVGRINTLWDNFWDDKKNSELAEWFVSWGHPKFWSTEVQFYENSGSQVRGGDELNSKSCTPSADMNGTGPLVCGAESPEQESKENLKKTLDSFNPHQDMLQLELSHLEGRNAFGTGNQTFCDDNKGSRTNVALDLKLRVQPDYWEPDFGYNNLANRYMRFDHTNKTLYGEGSYFKANPGTQNYYNGSTWEHHSEYGLATVFEAQRYTFAYVASNPLVFADEMGNDASPWSGSIQYKFMGPDANEAHYRAMMQTEGFRMDHTGIIPVVRQVQDAGTISSIGNPMQIHSVKNYYLTKLAFTVAPAMEPSRAVYQNPSVQVAYPFQGTWQPQTLGNQTLCANAALREVDDQDISCYKVYPGAARIHYFLNDWTDAGWNAAFLNANDNTLRNPVTVAHSLSNNTDPFTLSNVARIFTWTPAGTGGSIQIDTLQADSSHYSTSLNAWYITPSRIGKAPQINSDYGAAPDVTASLKLDDYNQIASEWTVAQSNGVVTSIHNAGHSLKDSIRYIRSKDTTTVDMASLRPLGRDALTLKRLQLQNTNHTVLGQPWIRNTVIANPQVWNRLDSSQKHPYFAASTPATPLTIDVVRTSSTPDTRPDEIATLRGRVPGEYAAWNLAYLQNGQLVHLASGKQPQNPPSTVPFPVLKEWNANRLQGNTSFFLTYGGQEAGSNLYFRQLDVHMGHLLNPQKTELVQSMYGNASVQFPAGAFSTPVDVTVRTVSLSDFNYRVFNDLDPVGTVIEVLPSHVFPAENPALWPRVAIQISKETLLAKKQNPLEAKIYKPDFFNKQLVPLEEQEIGFLLNGVLQLTCSETLANCDAAPADNQWDIIKISGKTPTFSAFMVMDSVKAGQVQPAADTALSDTVVFACAALSTADSLWMGLVNGYLEYPYPCQGSGNALLQLRNGADVMAEYQTLASQSILWKATVQDVPVHQLGYGSRLAVYGNNGKSYQMAGPTVLLDTVTPRILNARLSVTDLSPQKVIQLNASVSDAMSGVAAVKMEFYWAGKLVETRLLTESRTVTENFSLDKERQAECPGCQAQFFVTVEDKGHNFVRQEIRSANIYPYPTSLVLWYPLAEGYGSKAKEALGSGLDLQLVMSRPWLYGQSLYLYAAADIATSSTAWAGIGNKDAMSVEFRLRPGSLNKDKSYALISWNNNASPWVVGVNDGTDLFFRYGNRTVTFPAVIGIAKSINHYVLTVKGNVVSLFRDGSLSGTLDLGQVFQWSTNGKPVVGSYSGLPAMPGDLSNLRFYNKDLTTEDVYWLHAGSLNLHDSDFTIVRATSLTNRPGLVMDQSCEVPGQSYLRQESPFATGTLNWSVAPGSGAYRLYVLSRGYMGQPTGVEVYLNGASKGIHDLPANGLWESNAVTSLSLDIPAGAHTLSLRPLGSTGIAGLAIASAHKSIPASLVRWKSEHWSSPTPVVDVWMQYNSYADKTWIRPQFRLINLTNRDLSNVRLRYYFRGEGLETQPVAFYPQASMSVYADAGDVLYAELPLTEVIPAWGSAYWGNGPQIGLHRPEIYGPWYSEDDPSFDPNAVSGSLHKTDKVALVDDNGRLLNTWSCFEAGGPAVLNNPKVRALASDRKLGSAQSSLVDLVVENVGAQAIHGFEVRYYFRETEGKKPVWTVYSNQSADTALVDDGNGLYHVSFKYRNTILNPGEKTEYGNGVQFELHHAGWTADWNAGDDPSHAGLTSTLTASDSLIVLDLYGNVLWGSIPAAMPIIVVQKQETPVPHVMEQIPGGVAVAVAAAGNYSLVEVNAAGFWLQTLFSGTWDAGTQFVSTSNVTLTSGNYLVLRSGSAIVDQILVK